MPLNKMPTSGPVTNFPAGTFNTMVGICQRVESERKRFGRTPGRDILPPSFNWRNDSGEDAPSGAIVKVIDALHIKNWVGLKGTKPDTELALSYAISLGPVKAGKLGDCVLFDPARAKYATADGTPSFGQTWGVEPGSWELHKGRYGFEVQGFPLDGKVLVCPMPIRSFAGKVDSTLAKINGSDEPGSGTATLWYFDGTAYVESTITADVKNCGDDDIPANKLHKFTLTNGAWVVSAGGDSGHGIGKADSAIAAGSPGYVSIWTGTPGSETDSGDDVLIFNRTDSNIPSGGWVHYIRINGNVYGEPWSCT
jgi:hypothetical protein